MDARASSRSTQRRDDDGQGTNQHAPNYHRPRINQPALNEKEPRPQGAGAQLVQGQRVWPGTFGRKSTPAWATTPLNVTRYERPETAYRQNLGARVLFFKVAPGQPFCSSGQGMKSILAKASRSFDRFFPFRRFCTAGGACPMADMLLGYWSSRLPLEEYAGRKCRLGDRVTPAGRCAVGTGFFGLSPGPAGRFSFYKSVFCCCFGCLLLCGWSVSRVRKRT